MEESREQLLNSRRGRVESARHVELSEMKEYHFVKRRQRRKSLGMSCP